MPTQVTTLNINGINYLVVDAIEKMTVADSFVHRHNKIGTGNGEAKFYIGNEGEIVRGFFGPHGFDIKCFILRKDLLQYLRDTEDEYKHPAQPYINKNKMPVYWDEHLEEVNHLDDTLYFELKEQTQITPPRIYVKAEKRSKAYRLIREFSLPNITYLSAIKLQNPESGEYIYYFRLFVDYFGESQPDKAVEQELEKIDQEPIAEEIKIQLRQARIGQGKYREALLGECPFCPITMVTDDRLLIASHIKPWVKSDDIEKTDPKNGFMFTPTFDFLFDRGFITFSDDKRMIVSPWLSKMTCSKLQISPDKKYPLLPTENRERYLHYHRLNIFKG